MTKKVALSTRDRYLRARYGIGEAQYASMLAAQGGTCAICQKPPKNKALSVDHDHKTKRVRGLLCFSDNKFLIGRRTDPEPFRRAVAYLSRKKALGL